KQRMRPARLRLVFGVELTTKDPRVNVARQFDHLDEATVHRDAAEDESGAFELFAELRVELVTMSVSLAYLFAVAVDFAREAFGRKPALPCAESHRPAHLLDADEVAQLEDDRVRRVRIELRGVGPDEAADRARVLDDGGLHSQTDAEVRRARLARVGDGADHPGHAALAEASGPQ